MQSLLKNKYFKRLTTGALNGLRILTTQLGNALIAWFVIGAQSEALWGDFVEDLIFIGLAATWVGWGSKEYLLRAFSQDPSRIRSVFYTTAWAQALLLLVPVFVMFFLFSPAYWPGIGCWLMGNFVYRSFQVLIVYQRRFIWSSLIELGGLGLSFVALWLFKDTVDRFLLIWIFAGATAFKACLLAIILKPGKPVWGWNRHFFRKASPFFLIGLSGMFQSKMDLYVVNFMMDDSSVGIYQVVITLFLFYQVIAGFILEPFAKNLYRLHADGFRKLQLQMILLGLVVILVSLPFLIWVINSFYAFSLTWDFYVWGYLFAFPIFIFLPWIYLLYKQGKEKEVMWINFAGAFFNLLGTAFFINLMGLKGAILGSAIAQWLMLFVFFMRIRKKG